MIKSLSLVSGFALFAVTASPALADNLAFTRDGISYKAVVEHHADGSVGIVGQELASGSSFNLTVRGTRVSGHYNGQWTNFSANAPIVTQLSSR
jgi:hypothetical protein